MNDDVSYLVHRATEYFDVVSYYEADVMDVLRLSYYKGCGARIGFDYDLAKDFNITDTDSAIDDILKKKQNNY